MSVLREALHGIYAIVDSAVGARAALDGGIRVLQYRSKGAVNADEVRAIREITRARGALLVMNDSCAAALACDCDGVHLGPDDDGYDDVPRARALLGDDRLIGLSCGTADEARRAQAGGADYVGVGPVFATTSKDDAGDPLGVAGLRAVAAAVTLPVVAIGGISQTNIAQVRASGVAMAAVISALQVPDAAAAARALARTWTRRVTM